ncbi:MAG: DUF748 domain-containing protein [Candidatus Omnitrophota bacterium]
MRKKMILGLTISFLIAVIAMGFYWQSILAGLIHATLDAQYGLIFKYEKAAFSLFHGVMAFQSPTLSDANGAIASAKRLGVGVNAQRAVKGEVVFTKFEAESPNVEIKRLQDGSLQIAQAAKRIVPDATRQRESQKMDSPNTLPPGNPLAKFPSILLNDAQFNYYSGAAGSVEIHVVRFERFSLNPKENLLRFFHSFVYREPNKTHPFLQVDNLDLKNLFGGPELLTRIDAEGLLIEGKEIGKDKYDFNEAFFRWRDAVEEVARAISPPDPAKPKSSPTFQSFHLQDVAVIVSPQSGNNADPGAIRIAAQTVEYDNKTDALILTDLLLQEAGKSTLSFKRLAFAGLRQGVLNLETIEMDGVRLFLRSGEGDRLNLSRAIQRIQSVIQSLIPEAKKTASVPETENIYAGLGRIHLADAAIYSLEDGRETQKIACGDLRYEEESGKGSLDDFSLVSMPGEEEITHLAAPHLTVQATDWNKSRRIEKIHVQNMTLRGTLLSKEKDLGAAIHHWRALVQQLHDELKIPSAAAPREPMRIGELQLADAQFHLTDNRFKRIIQHAWSPVNLQWHDLVLSPNPPMGRMQFNAVTVSPTGGFINFQGEAAPCLDPIDIQGNLSLLIHDLIAYEPCYEESLPVGIEKGRFSLDGNMAIRKNMMDSVFNMTLLQPEFTANKGKWPEKWDRKTAITALNGMKNKNGDIVFRDNRLMGDVRNPEFGFGTSVAEILGRNLANRLMSLPNLVFDAVKTVGDAVIGTPLRKIFGGENP